MRSITTAQQQFIDGNTHLLWLFEVDLGATGTINHRFSNNTCTWGGESYHGKIVDFAGIRQMRPKTEQGSVICLETAFVVSDATHAFNPTQFENAHVTIRLIGVSNAPVVTSLDYGSITAAVVTSLDYGSITAATTTSLDYGFVWQVDHVELGVWKVEVIRSEACYGKLNLTCTDFIQSILAGDYPNTDYVSSLYPSDIDDRSGLCVPLPIGTAYLPLSPFYHVANDTKYYMLGSSDKTYTVQAVHSPVEGPVDEWLDDNHGGTYKIQDTISTIDVDWKVIEPEIVDSNSDGNADSCGFWGMGQNFFPIVAKFSRSDTATLTNPASAISFVLADMGVNSGDIDTSNAVNVFTGWGLTFGGGWVSKHARMQVLANMLCQCHSTIQITDKVELHPLTRTPQGTITKSLILNFKYSRVTKAENDSGHIAWQEAGKPQDRFNVSTVPAKGSLDNPSGDTFLVRFVQDTDHAQRIGILRNQRLLLRHADIGFTGLFKIFAYQPGDVVTVNDDIYGGNYPVMLDYVHLKKDGYIDCQATRYKEDLDDWDELSPAAIVVAESTSINTWTPVYAGPDSSGDAFPNKLPGKLRVGITNNYILLDPEEPIIKLYAGGNDRVLIGDLGVDDFGILLKDADGNDILRLDGTPANNLFAGWKVTEHTLTSDSGEVGLNSEETPGVDWRFWAGHATPGSAQFRVDSEGNLYATSATIEGSITATTGAIGGWTVASGTLASGDLTLDATNARIQAGPSANTYVRISPDGIFGVDNILGTTFSLPTDGSAPTFSSGIINSTVFNITSAGILETSSTAGDGTVNGAGVRINDTGIKGWAASNATPNFFLDATDGTVTAIDGVFSGEVTATTGAIADWTIGATSLTSTNIGIHSGANAEILLGHATTYADAKIGLKNDGSGKLADGNIVWNPAGDITMAGTITASATIQDSAENLVIDFTAATITVGAEDGLVVESGGGITLTGDDVTPGNLAFEGSLGTVLITNQEDGTYFNIGPIDAGIDCVIGGGIWAVIPEKFRDIDIISYREINLNQWAGGALDGISEINLTADHVLLRYAPGTGGVLDSRVKCSNGQVDIGTYWWGLGIRFIPGVTVYQGSVVINENSEDIDFRVETVGNINTLFVDGGNNRVGIGTAIPGADLDIGGIASHTINPTGDGDPTALISKDANLRVQFNSRNTAFGNEYSRAISAIADKQGSGDERNYAIRGYAKGSNKAYGVYGAAYGSGTNYGVYGIAEGGSTNWAGYFSGDVNITGTLDCGSIA